MLITDRDALKRFASTERIWQGIPSLERTNRGTMYCCLYSGNVKETWGNYVVLLRSNDDGKSWTEPVACAYSGEHSRCYDANLWLDPLGRLWWWWAVMPVSSVWAVICDDPDAEELTWSMPRCIGGEVMMNKPIVTEDGRWLFPMAVWSDQMRDAQVPPTFGPEKYSFVWESRDQGRTITRLGGADVPDKSYDEHMVLQKRDGSLLMLIRTAYGIGKSVSVDGGHTWSLGTDSGIHGPCSRFFLWRLASGNVLLVNNDTANGTRNPTEPQRRTHLSAWLSRDDCETWEGPLLLDERSDVSYPDGTERDGYLWIVYDRERGGFRKSLAEAEADAREVLFAKITEEDILAGALVHSGSSLKNVISKLGHYEKDASAYYREGTWQI